MADGGLAARYTSVLLPEKGNILTYQTRISKPVFRKCYFPFCSGLGWQHTLVLDNINYLWKPLQLSETGLEIQLLLSEWVHKNKTVKI